MIMTCSIEPTEPYEVMWFKNGNPLFSDGARVLVTCRNDVQSLIIKDCIRDDIAEYACIARNFHGRAATSGVLQIIGPAMKRAAPAGFSRHLTGKLA